MSTGLGEIVLYRAADGGPALDVRLEQETVWLSLNQLSDLFERDKSVISRHLRNVFKEGELERAAVVAKNATTAADGKTYQVEFFNLDAIISVGYRVNSLRGTQFRIWATNVLRQHLVQGLTEERYRELIESKEEAALARIKASLEDAKAGRVTSHDSVEALMQHLDNEPAA
jgi:hypothetical protein